MVGGCLKHLLRRRLQRLDNRFGAIAHRKHPSIRFRLRGGKGGWAVNGRNRHIDTRVARLSTWNGKGESRRGQLCAPVGVLTEGACDVRVTCMPMGVG